MPSQHQFHKKLSIASQFLVCTVLSFTACGTSADQYIARGNRFFGQKWYEEADLNYQKAIQKDPSSGEAYYRLGLSQFNEGLLLDANNSLIMALKLVPSREDVMIARAEAAFAAYLKERADPTFYDEVVRVSGILIHKNPNSYDGLRLKAYVAMIDNRFADALDLLKKADAVKPMQPAVVDAIIQSLIALDRFPEAEALGNEMIETNKTHGATYDILSNYYVTHNRKADAERLMRTRVANNPDVASYRLELAHALLIQDKTADMLAVLKEFVADTGKFPNAHLEAGDFLAGAKRYDDALLEYDAGATLDTKRAALYYTRAARVLIALKRVPDASDRIAKALTADANNEEAHALHASVSLDSGDAKAIAQGRDELKALVARRPENALYHFYLGRAYVAESDSEDALTEFTQAAKLDAHFLEPRLMVANISMQRQDYRLASQMADDILRLTRNDPSAMLVKAASLTGMGDFSGADNLLRQLETKYPTSPAPRLQQGVVLLEQKKYPQAELIFKTLYEADRTDLAALNQLLETYYRQEKYDVAIQYMTQETRRNNSEAMQALLADAALRGRKLDLAIQNYSELARRDPRSATKHLKLGDAHLQKGDVDEAIKEFQIGKDLAPQDPLVNAMLALAYHTAGKSDEAVKAYRATLALQSRNPEVKNNLAYLIAEMGGNLDEALRWALEAAREMPTSPAMSDTVGWVYYKKRASDSAVQVLTNVVQKQPNEPIYRYHLAAALLQKGANADAKRELEKAMASHPTKVYEAKIKQMMAQMN